MLSEDEKTELLEQAVISKTPGEIKRFYMGSGEVGFTAYALGTACLYRGLDTVKALVECGADFRYPGEGEPVEDEMRFSYYKRAANSVVPDYSLMITGRSKLGNEIFKLSDDREALPVSERARVLDYLCDNAEKTGLNLKKLLYFSIRDGNEEFYSVLKKHGIFIYEKTRWIFNSAVNFGYSWSMDDFLNVLDENKFLTVFQMILREIDGEKIKLNMSFFNSYIVKILSPDIFKFLIDNFTGMNQMKVMKILVDKEDTACLAVAAEEGWLRFPRKRDELILYASDNGRIESTAWLLEFRNRTADLASEQEKAEKKAERELNADPDSVTALKQLWRYKKREDGTLSITGYKGNQTIVRVPEKIGKSTVTNIASGAIACCNVPRVTDEQTAIRKKIKRITLPAGLISIGYYAFLHLDSLEEINLPEGLNGISNGSFQDCFSLRSIIIPGSVKKIGDNAFSGCTSLKSVIIEEGVSQIGDHAFDDCGQLVIIDFPKSVESIGGIDENNVFNGGSPKLTARVFKGSYAEHYCLTNGISIEYKQQNA